MPLQPEKLPTMPLSELVKNCISAKTVWII